MKVFLSVVAAVIVALLLIWLIIRISMWMTARKPTEAFKRERKDASEIHRGTTTF